MASAIASSASVQSFISRPLAGISTRNGLNQVGSFRINVLPKRASVMRVRSSAEKNEKEIFEAPHQQSSQPKPADIPKPSQPYIPAPKPKATSTRFEDILAFSGPGPERINGRLAMIGFVTALGVEISKGQDLFSQIDNGGLQWFLGTSIVLSVASLIPLFKGVRAETETRGVMNADAELWNGRFAMLGLVALAFTEYVLGGALV